MIHRWNLADTHPRELHERLLLRNEQTKQIRLPEVYKEDENAKLNVSTWMNSQFIYEAVDKLLPVCLISTTCNFPVCGPSLTQT